MAHIKDKLQVFVMGIMLGLIVGGGFFILKLDGYFKELNFYKHLSENQKVKTDLSEENKATNKNNQNYNKTKIPLKVPSTINHLDTLKKVETILSKRIDSLGSRDTLHLDLVEEKNINGNIVVRKDELLAALQIEMENLSVLVSNNKDSLLQKISGIRDDKNNAKQLMNVEFWRSPINYKGYKMAKGKIILFGIVAQNEIRIYRIEEATYIKLQQAVYKLEYTNDFRQLERINDEGVLARLK